MVAITIVRDDGSASRVTVDGALTAGQLARRWSKKHGPVTLTSLDGSPVAADAPCAALPAMLRAVAVGAPVQPASPPLAVVEPAPQPASVPSAAAVAPPPPPSPSPRPPRPPIVVGGRYELRGLASRPDLNGMAAVVVADGGGDRCRCRCPGVAEVLAVKRDRLIPCAFAVRAIPGKDVGVVAARDLRRGERILKERPAMTARTTEDHAASALDASDAPDFWDLHDCHAVGETKTVLGICRTNCFELRDPATGDTRSGMFLLGSRFNHDCSPNVHRTWLPDEGVEVYHALRDVPEGAELCGEYLFGVYRALRPPPDSHRHGRA